MNARLTEQELDARNADRCCNGNCQQGDLCPLRITPEQAREQWSEVALQAELEVFPSLESWWVRLAGAVCLVSVIGYCVLTQGA